MRGVNIKRGSSLFLGAMIATACHAGSSTLDAVDPRPAEESPADLPPSTRLDTIDHEQAVAYCANGHRYMAEHYRTYRQFACATEAAQQVAIGSGIESCPTCPETCRESFDACMLRQTSPRSGLGDCPTKVVTFDVSVGQISGCIDAFFVALGEFGSDDCQACGVSDGCPFPAHVHTLHQSPACNGIIGLTATVLGVEAVPD